MIHDLQRKMKNYDDDIFQNEELCGWNVDVDLDEKRMWM